mgnify:CR=1 FL=1
MANTSARQALRQQQAREAEQAKKRRLLLIGGLVLLVIAALIAGFWGMGEAKRKADQKVVASNGVLANALVKIPASNFDTVGVGSANHAPTAIPNGKPALVDGKPRILYIGAEFCPYCAMDRLSLVSALSRFGTFKDLGDVLSSPNEGPVSNIPTVTFRKATFSSDTVAFTGVETSDRMGQPLDKPTAEDTAIFQQYAPGGGIPFIYYGSGFANSAPYDGAFLAGKKAEDIAAQLQDPNSETSKAVLGGANVMTAQICKETGGKPATVCTSAGVTAAAKTLK